ncbi:MAG: MoaD/ThiS family protein [Sphingomonadales bacterium]|nr:MoaD/ThiS family protein [Sphingomonadales bacterium]
MARVLLTPAVLAEFPGAAETGAVEAVNLFQLVRELDARFPCMGPWCDARAAFAVDGVSAPDWSQRLGPDSEVLIITRIAGG